MTPEQEIIKRVRQQLPKLEIKKLGRDETSYAEATTYVAINRKSKQFTRFSLALPNLQPSQAQITTIADETALMLKDEFHQQNLSSGKTKGRV